MVNFKTGKTSHHEALLRIRQENGDLVFPGEFVDILRQSGTDYGQGYYLGKPDADFLEGLELEGTLH